MLKKILSPETCGKCRVCCVFDRDDIWEIPLISAELYKSISEQRQDLKLIPRKNSYVFNMEFKDNGLTYCPALSDTGCTLGENKPFDCKIWPFRAMRKDNGIVITLSPVCEHINPEDKAVKELAEELSETIFREADKNPDIIKDYIDGYPVLISRDLP
ncbi:MAG: hypothetical protein IJZ65_06550 [Ruminiclostridium sp.]|nr:hypothetical protein [Ruminiclostridium sp.]